MNDFDNSDNTTPVIKTEVAVVEAKRGRGRPKGSKNKPNPDMELNGKTN